MAGRRVVIVDDVITAGTAIREAVQLLRDAGAVIVGVAVCLDRQERVSEESSLSAVQVRIAFWRTGLPFTNNLNTPIVIYAMSCFTASGAGIRVPRAGSGVPAAPRALPRCCTSLTHRRFTAAW